MTRHRMAAVAAAVFLTITAGSATAAGSATVDVTASVSAVCKFTAETMTAIALGAIDPSTVAADVTATGDITYKCTKGTTPTVSITGGGTRTLTDSSTSNTIPYSLTLGTHDAGTGFSSSAAATKVVATARITQANAQDAKAGTAYAETVTLTINN